MTIALDARSLEESEGGIPDYTRCLTHALLSENMSDTIVVFTNSFRASRAHNDINFGIPNKLLNTSFALRHRPYVDQEIEKRIGRKVDLVFMPNMNFIAVSPQTKLVVTAHDLSYEHYPGFLSFRSRAWHTFVKPKKLFQRAHRIIAVSEYTKQDLIRTYGIPENKVHVVYHGIDSSFFLPYKISREQLKVPARYLLAVGMGSERKNLPLLLGAYQELRKDPSYHDISLLITGACNPYSRNVGSIQYIGYPSKTNYHGLLSYAEALVYPSIFEGFGLPILEAFACGVPVIASAHSSISEIGGDAFYPIDPFNVSSLATAMRDILTLPKLRQILSEKGRKRAEFFSWKKCATETLQVCKEVL